MTLRIGPNFAIGGAFGWAWAAGLFEGEGCIQYAQQSRNGRTNGSKRRLQIAMTDRDVLETFMRHVGAGKIRSKGVVGNRKPCWEWAVNRWSDVLRIGTAMLPFLHARRRAKMVELLSNPTVRGGKNCPQGHPLFGPSADTYVHKGRSRPVCAVCVRARMRTHRRAA